MKKYLLFAGDNYYPAGGWNDFIREFEALELAQAKAMYRYKWWHIVDSETKEIVDESP